MKKSMYAALGIMALSLMILPLAGRKVNSGKEQIVITEEVLSGDPSAAAGVTLELASHWENHLLWDTTYTIGSGRPAESVFTFSAEETGWYRIQEKSAGLYIMSGAGFGSASTCTAGEINPEDLPFPEVIRAAAERTKPGEAYTEVVRIGDYAGNYPLDFQIDGSSVEYLGDYNENVKFLTEFFHISTGEDRMELTTEKDEEGTLIGVSSRTDESGGEMILTGASAFGEAGCYYAYNCERIGDGKAADREQNSGIFYLPFLQEEGWLAVEVTQIRKVCGLPGKVVPEGMLLDEAGRRLYLAVRGEEDYLLCVYTLEGETPVLKQQIRIRQNERTAGGADSKYLRSRSEDKSCFPALRQIREADGGLLITWSDNAFAFVTEEEGKYRLWSGGSFPDRPEQEYEYVREKPFPAEHGCIFDGKRLVLAAYEAWESLNVVLAVYDEGGEVYSGLYGYDGGPELYQENYVRSRILPQGQENRGIPADRYPGELYLEGTDILVEPLRLRE